VAETSKEPQPRSARKADGACSSPERQGVPEREESFASGSAISAQGNLGPDQESEISLTCRRGRHLVGHRPTSFKMALLIGPGLRMVSPGLSCGVISEFLLPFGNRASSRCA